MIKNGDLNTMCLTVCRKRELIYDNDRTTVCQTCPFKNKAKKTDSCTNCSNFFSDGKTETCLLSQMVIPSNRWCCHHNADSHLSYYPFDLKRVDGIVLVPMNEVEEAMSDYKPSYSKIVEKKASISSSLFDDDEDTSVVDDHIFDTVNDGNNDDNNFDSAMFEISEDKYGYLSSKDITNGIYVPIKVGQELIDFHQGIDDFVKWFEEIFGGKKDIIRDWKGRYIIKTYRFATPAVYGIVSSKWSELVSEDLTDLLHEFFN